MNYTLARQSAPVHVHIWLCELLHVILPHYNTTHNSGIRLTNHPLHNPVQLSYCIGPTSQKGAGGPYHHILGYTTDLHSVHHLLRLNALLPF